MPSDRTLTTRSAAFRGALWITLIALLATGAALTFQYVQTTRLLAERMHAVVDDEAAALIERYQSEGVVGVAQAIERRQQLPRLNELFYLLSDSDGSPIVGNLAAWPSEVEAAGYHSFTTEVTGLRGDTRWRWVEARAVILGGGFRLLVGSLSDERMLLRERYLSILFWSFLPTGLLGLLLGYWYSRRGLSFVDAAAAAGERFLSGRLEERLPITTRGDEYDRLAQSMNRSFEEVERLVRSLQAATDGLAHDLKTPLTRIRARLELAEMARSEGEDFHALAIEVQGEIDALIGLIDDVLSLARAEATATSNFAPLSLDAIVAEAVELYQPLAEEKRIVFASSVAEAHIVGARTLVAQTVTNLLDNAIKYAPENGSIRIELTTSDGLATLSVCDNGPGIPPGQREAALARFGRLDASRSKPGSGIGLSIVAATARVHRAELELLDNDPGLCVVIRFPRRESVPAGGDGG